jgi:small nuclear ribonucleoprotein (snRNP)-like protein
MEMKEEFEMLHEKRIYIIVTDKNGKTVRGIVTKVENYGFEVLDENDQYDQMYFDDVANLEW